MKTETIGAILREELKKYGTTDPNLIPDLYERAEYYRRRREANCPRRPEEIPVIRGPKAEIILKKMAEDDAIIKGSFNA